MLTKYFHGSCLPCNSWLKFRSKMETSGTILRSIHHLGLDLLRALAQKDQGNVFLSPFSLSSALSMMYCGARGDTALEMNRVFGYEDLSVKDIAASFDHLLSSLGKVPESYNLEHANAAVMQGDLPIKEEYKKMLEESFHAVLLHEDVLRNPQQVLARINEWVRNKTHAKIDSLLDELDPDTVIVLLNAVYFKGTWEHQFEKESTRRQKFHNGGGRGAPKEVDMMHQKEKFDFVEMETYKALQLPYQGGDIAMLILLPNSHDGLEALEGQLAPTFVEDLRKQMFNKKVKVALPRFRMEYCKSLRETFEDLGVRKVFSMDDADLTGICEPSQLNVSSIHHKAVIEVNEEGSEASAATAVSFQTRCFVREPEFIVDHPFLFTLYNTKTNLNLFMGRVVEL